MGLSYFFLYLNTKMVNFFIIISLSYLLLTFVHSVLMSFKVAAVIEFSFIVGWRFLFNYFRSFIFLAKTICINAVHSYSIRKTSHQPSFQGFMWLLDFGWSICLKKHSADNPCLWWEKDLPLTYLIYIKW